MAVITRSRVIPAPAERIWELLADFGALSDWVDDVAHSCLLHRGAAIGIGTSRRVQTNRITLVETITQFEAPHELAYDIEGLPARVRGVNNRWSLSGGARTTDVTITSTFHVAAGLVSGPGDWLVGRVMATTTENLLSCLARRMENADDQP